MNNPLFKVRLNWWENYLIVHIFGTAWQSTLWNNAVSALEIWLSQNETATVASVQSFINSHIASFMSVIMHANPILCAAVQGVLGPIFNMLTTGLMAYAEAKLAAAEQAAKANTGEVVPASANAAASTSQNSTG